MNPRPRDYSAERLAEKFGLILCLDRLSRHKPRYMVHTDKLADLAKRLSSGHWAVNRYPEPPRLVPRHAL